MLEASEYCKKDDNFTEFDALKSDKRKVNQLRDVPDKAEVGDYTSINADYRGIYLRYKAEDLLL